ncbi:hypothetical protein SLEP1_g26714 [Rubroshorea leprosula]|uniref:Ankyrin repeat domain-containing protein n=1 Tax=Rubroshorea leprosula TaxID=152421 RepID=A0AAV5JYQ2_9ROSI|nr:hypothetical protein SLEP1_g26714 [Rubroshorea leprosula]
MIQVAIPVVPTVRVVITFTKFEELQPTEQFYTPLSSPRFFATNGGKEDQSSDSHYSSVPWQSSSSSSSSSSGAWLRRSNSRSASASKQQRSSCAMEQPDPFAIPSGYTWTSVDDKSNKIKKSKSMRKSK